MKHIEINGINISYQKTGRGNPMLLVHGNGEDHRIFDRTVSILKSRFTFYLIDSRGHGKSSRVSEFHYRDMAEDMILFMEKLDLQGVTFVGFSDGGIIGLMAAANTKRIRTLIVCGANLRPEGLKGFYRHPMRFLNIFRKDPLLKLMLEEPDLTDKELRRIQADTLILAGRFDLIKRAETEHIAKLIPHARLMILPWETHTSYVVHSEKLGRILLRYLDDLRKH